MLDSQRQGKIPKDDLYKHFLPLLQKVGGAAPSRKGSTWRKGSTKRVSIFPVTKLFSGSSGSVVVLLGEIAFRWFSFFVSCNGTPNCGKR